MQRVVGVWMCLSKLRRKKWLIQNYYPNIQIPTLEIRKHQLYFKQTVISVKSWAWQPHQEILQGKTIQTQHLLPLPSSIPTCSWITVNVKFKSNTKQNFWHPLEPFLVFLPSLKFYILSGVFLTSWLINKLHE